MLPEAEYRDTRQSSVRRTRRLRARRGRPGPEQDATDQSKQHQLSFAVSRIYLDNILNIQSSWVTPGLKTCQLGLRFGGNDVGSIMIEENVVSAAGTHHQATEEELRRMIRDAGFVPKQRDTLYRTYFLN